MLDQTVLSLFGNRRVRGRYGVEVELEGRGLGLDAHGWHRKAEASLRNGGMEYVLDTPLGVDRLPAIIRNLTQATSEARLDMTHRTSTHIHVNMQDETILTVLRYIVIYTLVDSIVVEAAGAWRNGNVFCMNMSDTGDLPLAIEYLLQQLRKGTHAGMHPRGKYASLNLNTLWTFGSLECRVFPASVQEDDIMRWVTWLDNILKLAKSSVSLREIVDVALSTPENILMDVFGRPPLPIEECRRLLSKGASNAYEVIVRIEAEQERTKKKKVQPEAPPMHLDLPDPFAMVFDRRHGGPRVRGPGAA